MLIENEQWRKNFFTCYFNNDREKRENGFELLHAKRPEIFCKYMSPEHALDFLNTHQLWFSSVRKFNDPMDGQWYFFNELENGTEEQKVAIQYFKECCGLDDKIEETDTENITIRDISLICSLTTNPLDNKMWGDYANRSKGVCFEFDVNACNLYPFQEIHKILFPVIYCDEKVDLTDRIYDCYSDNWYNPIFGTGFQDYFFLLSVLLKNSYYSNENEWRAIWRVTYPEEKGSHFILQTVPSSIYLGSKIDQELKNLILEKERTSNIYQVHENDGELVKELIQLGQTHY